MTPPRILFDCEVLTPLFLAGADPNGSPELRAPSIRGALRWWYRALLGGRGLTDLAALREAEQSVFGRTGRASPVRLRVLPYEVAEQGQPSKQIPKLSESNTGTAYLWHFVQAGDNNREYVAPGARFEVQLLAKPGDEEALEEAAAAFWLLVHLGGLGTRSRRMAGAVAADLIDAPGGVDVPSFAPEEDYDTWFQQSLRDLGVGGASVPALPAFSLLHPRHTDIHRLEGVSREDWEELVEMIGTAFKEHREDLEVPEKVGLGLPIVTPEKTDDITVTQQGREVDRRASPLWLQVVRLRGGSLSPLVTFMRSQFARDGTSVKVSWEGKSESVDDPYRMLGTFVRDDRFDSVSLLPADGNS